MKKNAIVLLGDYWHPAETIEPLLPMIFDEKEWNVKVTDDPNYIGATMVAPDLIMNFKDGIANTSIPTTNWYTNDTWSPFTCKMLIEGGGAGYIGALRSGQHPGGQPGLHRGAARPFPEPPAQVPRQGA